MRFSIALIVICLCSLGMAQDIDYVREQAQILSSADMMGRGYVGGGLDRAANHIIKEFEEAGLKPMDEGKYSQAFSHTVNRFAGAMELTVEGLTLQPGIDYLVDPMSGGVQGDYRVIRYRADALSQVPSIMEMEDCSDCMLVINTAGIEDKQVLSDARNFAYGYTTAVPVIWLTEEKYTWSVGNQQLPNAFVMARPMQFFDGALVHFDIEAELVKDFRSSNIMAMVPGTEHPDSFIVFTAHYDHLGMMGPEACFYGANDNASGVATMLSLARHYATSPGKYSTVFIAFAGEEAGLVGSKHFVEQPLVDLSAIRFLINIDLMGSGVEGITVVNAKAQSVAYDLLLQINAENNYLPKIKARGQAANSDHYYFVEAGVPAVFIYALGGSQAYHDVQDVYANLTFEEYPDIFRLITTWVSHY